MKDQLHTYDYYDWGNNHKTRFKCFWNVYVLTSFAEAQILVHLLPVRQEKIKRTSGVNTSL